MAEQRGNGPFALFSGAVPGILIRLIGLGLIDALGIWLAVRLFQDGNWHIALAFVVVTIGLNVIFLVEGLYPFRWLSPGLALMVIMVIYPVLVTIYFAFTNYRTGHLLTKPVAIERITERPEYRFIPEDSEAYNAIPFRNEAGEYLLWLEGRDTGEQLIAYQDGPVEPVTQEITGTQGVTFEETDDGTVVSIEGYTVVDQDDAPGAIEGANLNYGAPLDSLTIATIEEDADGEGFVFDPVQGLAVDYTSRGDPEYNVTVFESDTGAIALWMTDDRGRETILARPDAPVVVNGVPQSIQEYAILSAAERLQVAEELTALDFGESDTPIRIDAFSANRAGRFQQLYTYDDDADEMIHQPTGARYTPIEGVFTLVEDSVGEETATELEETLTPGFYVTIGLENFDRLFNTSGIWGPFVTVFIWTVIHAGATVLITFGLGMAMALLFDDQIIPAKKILRSLILIPYAIPAFISVVVWRGMFDPNLGFINDLLNDLFGWEPNWYAEAMPARAAILLIQLWLGFPYMMLVITGALQGIPSDMYEAAEVDGANAWQKFHKLTLPLVLVTVGPLLIASFAFNFNNFTVIELYNSGGPAIPGSTVPTGYTDILITYTYAQAFGTQGGTDYAFASTISIFIFLIVAAITIVNFRFTNVWEEVSENV